MRPALFLVLILTTLFPSAVGAKPLSLNLLNNDPRIGNTLGPFMIALRKMVQANWTPQGGRGRVSAFFVILRDGRVGQIVITQSSGNVALDKSAVNAIHIGSPYPRPPAPMDSMQIQANFDSSEMTVRQTAASEFQEEERYMPEAQYPPPAPQSPMISEPPLTKQTTEPEPALPPPSDTTTKEEPSSPHVPLATSKEAPDTWRQEMEEHFRKPVQERYGIRFTPVPVHTTGTAKKRTAK